MTTSSYLINCPSFNLQENDNLTLLARNFPSHTDPLKTRYQLSKESVMQKRLLHAL